MVGTEVKAVIVAALAAGMAGAATAGRTPGAEMPPPGSRTGSPTGGFPLPARLSVWELPRTGAMAETPGVPAPRRVASGDREGWKPADGRSRFAGGLAVENDRLTVLVATGAHGPILRAKGTSAAPQAELRILAAGAARGRVVGARLTRSDENEAVIGLTTGTAEAELALRVGAAHVEVRPGRNAEALEVRATGRYVIVPDFVAHDALYDAARQASGTSAPSAPRSPGSARAKPGGVLPGRGRGQESVRLRLVAVPADNVLMQLLDGNQAILMLLWKGTLDAKAPDAKSGKAKPWGPKGGGKPSRRNVELLCSGQGALRRFTASRVKFLGRGVYVGLLHGTKLWHEASLRELPGAKTVSIGWKRPFDARWRADFTVEGFDENKVAAFLKLAARLGLSKGKEKSWRAAYRQIEGTEQPLPPLGAPRTQAALQAGSARVVSESYNFRTPNERGQLPQYTPWGHRAEGLAWPCIFADAETLLTPLARWPCYPDPTKDALDPIQRQRAAQGKEPLCPIHPYGRAIIYPIDRTRTTPLTVYTVVDVLREALGIGPCPWDWLEEGQRRR